MTEAIFGQVGVFVGSGISWLQSYWTGKNERNKSARYAAIRIVCVLDKFLQDCTDVVNDDGLNEGQRNSNGCLAPQINHPTTISYPEDVDWKSIDSEIMFKLLSFPSEIEDGNRLIQATEKFAEKPDYADWFNERKYYYCTFGLFALKLSNEISKKYGVKTKKYIYWDPEKDLNEKLSVVNKQRRQRIEEHKNFVKRVSGKEY